MSRLESSKTKVVRGLGLGPADGPIACPFRLGYVHCITRVDSLISRYSVLWVSHAVRSEHVWMTEVKVSGGPGAELSHVQRRLLSFVWCSPDLVSLPCLGLSLRLLPLASLPFSGCCKFECACNCELPGFCKSALSKCGVYRSVPCHLRCLLHERSVEL